MEVERYVYRQGMLKSYQPDPLPSTWLNFRFSIFCESQKLFSTSLYMMIFFKTFSCPLNYSNWKHPHLERLIQKNRDFLKAVEIFLFLSCKKNRPPKKLAKYRTINTQTSHTPTCAKLQRKLINIQTNVFVFFSDEKYHN